MVVKVNSTCEEEQFEEEIEGRINLKLELEGALNELSKQRKKAKRATAAMKDIQSIAERFQDEKIVLEEKVHQLEQELGKLQSEATNLQNSEDILSMINVEKEMLEQENKILLEKVEELTFKLEEQVKINDDMATELVAKAKQVETLEQKAKNKMKTFLETSFVSPCGESSNMSNDEARNESSMKLKKCIEMQRPHSMGKQGLGFEENIIPLMDENSGKTKVVHPTFDICDSNTTKEENREVQQKINGNQSLKFQFGRHGSFMRFNGYCFSCGKYGHRAIVCRNKNRSQVGSYPFLRQFGNWFGYNYQNRGRWGNQFFQHVKQDSRSFTTRRIHPHMRRMKSATSFSCPLNNSFQTLDENVIECERCNLIGHCAAECMTILPNQIPRQVNLNNQEGRGYFKGKKVYRKVERTEQANVVEIALKTKTKGASWVMDSGCTSHMTGDKKLLKNTQDVDKGFVKFADKSGLKIKGLGEATFGSEKLCSKEVLFVDGLKYNLMSVSQLCDCGHEVLFTQQGCIVKSSKNGEIVAKGTRNKKDLYLIDEKENTCLLSSSDENTLWHKRLGHINQKSMRELVKNKAVRNLPELKRDKDSICSTCQKGKMA